MVLYLSNTLTKQREVFRPRKEKKVDLFVCGPTVYDYIHVGNARCFSFFDTLAKYLRYRGYQVTYVQNITDIDDKIINRAREEKSTPIITARTYTKEFFIDIRALHITAVDHYAPATKYVTEIIAQVQRLMQRGYAYETADGVYFDISRFPRYGQLSRVNMKENAISRVDVSETKRHPEDFCLWKKYKSGDPWWKAPMGKGRPGWHIEDTAISEHFFGPQYDIHGGGIDLIFPHHEAEITQMEAASGKHPFVRYWLHNGFVTVNGEKMSKSLGNFITARQAVQQSGGETLRLFFNQTHYRAPVNCTTEALDNAKNSLRHLHQSWERLRDMKKKAKAGKNDPRVLRRLVSFQQSFEQAMDEDLNTAVALAVLFEFSSFINTLSGVSKETWLEVERVYVSLGNILGLLYEKQSRQKIPPDVLGLAKKREQARQTKQWGESDRLRIQIAERGYVIEDTTAGQKIKKK